METIQIIDENQMKVINQAAKIYAQEMITDNIDDNFATIRDLKAKQLMTDFSHDQLRRDMMQQAKKREDVIQELRDQVEQLKRQIK